MTLKSAIYCDGERKLSWTRASVLSVLLSSALLLTGCVGAGPRSVRASHMDYNEALAQSVQEEWLMNIVRLRYREPYYFLAPANLTTSFKTESRVGFDTELDIGPGGNLLKPGTGFSFSSTPTVSYLPVSGKEFVRDVLTPVDPTALLALDQSGWSIERVFGIAVERINDLENAPTASGPTPNRTPAGIGEFNEVIERLKAMQSGRLVFYFRDPETGDLKVRLAESVEHERDLSRVRELLGLRPGRLDYAVSSNLGAAGPDTIAIGTRSLMGVLFYLSHSVEVPQAHKDAGWVTTTRNPDGSEFEWMESPAGRFFRVQYSAGRPANASVSVRYRGGWYYIADDDLDSKSTFMLLAQLATLQAGRNDSGVRGPALTLPVGG